MQDITSKYKVVNHVDKKTWSGSTGPGPTVRHATNLEKLKLKSAKMNSGRSTHQGATRKLNSQTSRVEEVC